MSVPPAGTVTFLFTDIEGSTRLWEEYPAAMRIALARHDLLVRETVEHYGGYVFKTLGDSFCTAFPSATAAVSAALAVRQALQDETWDAIGRLRVRIALHTGPAETRGGDYFGPALSRVTRLMSAGQGGQILLSGTTAQRVQNQLPAAVTLRDLGEYRLKDLVRPERIFQLVTPDHPDDIRPLRALEAFAHNLPIQVTSFIGREHEMADVIRLLAGTHLLTLTGPGGTGKTRLSLQVAADLLDDFADGVWLVELAALTDPALVGQAVASALGVREEAGRPLEPSLIAYLRAKHLLLVL
ncbi:MAG TPA: adenylate/guanylate cyclase domain-containing protein, partial [Chloroflexia bacterium]|nr:adenylate/guanylate cyclase domain-containing protein [Chloroflexia bacterium]